MSLLKCSMSPVFRVMSLVAFTPWKASSIKTVELTVAGLDKNLNSSLPMGQVTLKFCLPGHFSPLPRFLNLLIIHEPPPPQGNTREIVTLLVKTTLKEKTIIPFHVSMHFQTLRMHYENIVNAFWKIDNAFQWPLQWNENSVGNHFKTVAKHLEFILRHWQHISTNPKTIENHFESNCWLEQFLMHYNNCCLIALLFCVADSMESKQGEMQMVNLSLSWSLVQSSLRV